MERCRIRQRVSCIFSLVIVKLTQRTRWTTFAANVSAAAGITSTSRTKLIGGAFAAHTSSWSPQGLINNGILDSAPGKLLTSCVLCHARLHYGELTSPHYQHVRAPLQWLILLRQRRPSAGLDDQVDHPQQPHNLPVRYCSHARQGLGLCPGRNEQLRMPRRSRCQ